MIFLIFSIFGLQSLLVAGCRSPPNLADAGKWGKHRNAWRVQGPGSWTPKGRIAAGRPGRWAAGPRSLGSSLPVCARFPGAPPLLVPIPSLPHSNVSFSLFLLWFTVAFLCITLELKKSITCLGHTGWYEISHRILEFRGNLKSSRWHSFYFIAAEKRAR